MPDRFVYTTDDVLRMLDALLEGGSGYIDQQVYERASLGGGLGYSADRLRALWDRAPFTLRVLRQMTKTDGRGPYFGEDFLWALLATKAGAAR